MDLQLSFCFISKNWRTINKQKFSIWWLNSNLLAAFLYKSSTLSFLYFKFRFILLWHKKVRVKAAFKMLVKLTPCLFCFRRINFTNKLSARQWSTLWRVSVQTASGKKVGFLKILFPILKSFAVFLQFCWLIDVFLFNKCKLFRCRSAS